MSLPLVNLNNNNTLLSGPKPINPKKAEELRIERSFSGVQWSQGAWPDSSNNPLNLRIKEIDLLIESRNYNGANQACVAMKKICGNDPETMALLLLRQTYFFNEADQFHFANVCCDYALKNAKNEEVIAFIKMRQVFALSGLGEPFKALTTCDHLIPFFKKEPRYISILYALYLEKSRLHYQLNQQEEGRATHQLAQSIQSAVRVHEIQSQRVASGAPTDGLPPILDETNVDLSGKEFVPNLYPFAEHLHFRGGQFHGLPNLSGNIFLKTLDLSEKKLPIPPDFTWLSNIEIIFLENCGLTFPPNLELNPKLQRIYINNNNLKTLPNLSNNANLLTLNACTNELKGTFDFSDNPLLSTLELSDNKLTEAPRVSNNPQLNRLNLSANQLTVAPDLSENKKLTYIDLSSNRLTELPDSILTLSEECSVIVSNNRFSHAYVHQFQQLLLQHRAQNPTQGPQVFFGELYESNEDDEDPVSLSDELETWSKEFENAFSSLIDASRTEPATSLLQFNEADEEVLGKFLKKMRKIPDYENPETKKNILLQVENILQLACKNGQFRDAMLLLAREGIETCADRTLIYFNKIEILYKFHDKSLTDEEFKQLALGAVKFDLLEEHGTGVYESRGSKKDPTNDEIEIILYFLVKLKESLVLPFTTKFMAFENWAKGTPAMVQEAKMKIKELSDLELLQQSGYWLKRMQEKFPELWNEIDTTYRALMDETSDYFQLKEEDQLAFLETHQGLQKFLTGPDREKVNMKDYNAVMKYLSRKKDEAIAGLL